MSCPAQDSPNPRGVLSSKASGEPSLMMSMGVLSALQQAAAAARRDLAELQRSRPESLSLGDIMGAVRVEFTVNVHINARSWGKDEGQRPQPGAPSLQTCFGIVQCALSWVWCRAGHVVCCARTVAMTVLQLL